MSKDKITAELVGKKYKAGIQAFARMLGDPTLRLNFTQEADPYFRRCALAVWSHGGPVTEEHVAAYNAICSGQNRAPAILYFELCSAVGSAPEFAPPAFFSELIRADRSTKRDLTGKFIELCSILLLLFAAVDDAVTPEEAAYADQCAEVLKAVSGSDSPIKATDYVTRKPQPKTDAPTQTQQEEETPPPPKESVEDLLAELDELCGLEQVKKDVRSLINLVKVRRLREENGLTVPL